MSLTMHQAAIHFCSRTNVPRVFSLIRYQKHTFANEGDRRQSAPKLLNPASQDPLLVNYLQERCPENIFKNVTEDVMQFGEQLADYVNEWGLQCEREQPWLEQYDAWNRRIDRLHTSEAWQRMKPFAATEGLVALAYENGKTRTEWDRLHQMLKIYLFGPSGGLYGCPLAMTDGAARVIENLNMPDSMKTAYEKLTTRNPNLFWTSGQWMTERMGGSDVGNGTETVAYPQPDGSYALHGYKWFSSATDADMSLLLAREMDPQTQKPMAGSRGLSLFYLQLRDPHAYRQLPSGLNGIQVVRLKKKMGTRQLPTAELLLDGARAVKLSATGRGVASIVGMLQITRLHCISHNVGTMRRILQLSRDYAMRREAFGAKIGQQPLHVSTLLQMEVDCQASFLGFTHVSHLVGRADCGLADEKEVLLTRLLTALLKMYTSKQAVWTTSEGLESFGGQGYMEDTGLPALLRDVHVNCIWEGTTNVICLDALRTIAKSEGQGLRILLEDVRAKASLGTEVEALREVALVVKRGCEEWEVVWRNALTKWDQPKLHFHLRTLMFGLTRLYLASRMVEHCRHAPSENLFSQRFFVLREWMRRDSSVSPPLVLKEATVSVTEKQAEYLHEAMAVLMENYSDEC